MKVDFADCWVDYAVGESGCHNPFSFFFLLLLFFWRDITEWQKKDEVGDQPGAKRNRDAAFQVRNQGFHSWQVPRCNISDCLVSGHPIIRVSDLGMVTELAQCKKKIK
jgi:hypothetical protein